MVSYKLFNREVNNPLLKTLAVLAPVAIVVASAPALIPMHFVLRRMNRNGFWYDHQLKIGKDSFQKQGYY